MAKLGKDPIYRTKVIVQKPVRPPAIPNHIIRPVLRQAYKNEFGQNPEENIILIGPGQYTKILTGQYYTVIDRVRGQQLLFEESVYN